MVKSENGNNLVNISRNSLTRYSGHINIDSKPYAKYPTSSSLKISCAQHLSIAIMAVEKDESLFHTSCGRKYAFAFFCTDATDSKIQ